MENQKNQKAQFYNQFLQEDRFLNSKLAGSVAFSLLAFSSAMLFRNFLQKNCINFFKESLGNVRPINLIKDQYLQNYLVYAQGNLIQKSKSLAQDQLFNVTSTDVNNFGLYRKVEVFQKNLFRSSDKYWQEINMLIDRNQLSKELKLISEVKTNGEFFLDNYSLTNPLLIQLSNGNSLQQSINQETMQKVINELIQKHQINQNSKDSIKQKELDNQVNQNDECQPGEIINPLEELINSGKHIEIKDDYVYIYKEKNKITNGDIRISFHDIKRIAEITVLAKMNNKSLEQFVVEQVINRELDFDYIYNGKSQKLIISLFSFIQSGSINQDELILSLKKAASKKQNLNILLYSLIIFSINLFVQNQFTMQFSYYDEQYNSIKRKEMVKYILEQQVTLEKPSKIFDKKQFEHAFYWSGSGIIILRMLSYGFIFSSIFFGTCYLFGWSNMITEKIQLEDQFREDLIIIQQENTVKSEENLKIIEILNNLNEER